jgi:serine/threonine-protein kinase
VTTTLECPGCRHLHELDELPSSGVVECAGCGRTMVLRPSGTFTSAEETLARVLVDQGYITGSQLDQARRTQTVLQKRNETRTLAEILVARSFVTDEQIEHALGETGDETAVVIPGYQVVEVLGKGGMGTVYRGVHLASGKAVAIKVLAPRMERQRDALERFHREARVAIDLDHPHIVKGYDEGAHAHTHYFVMEYVDGCSALQVLRRRGRFSERRAMSIAREIADAIRYAHGRGMLHRDIKPDNILLARSGHAKLADYGLVKLADDAALAALTASGTIMGTPHYISPEQAAADRVPDIRSDIYSLGATLHHLLTGEPPFAAYRGPEVMQMHIYGRVSDPRELVPELSAQAAEIVLRMTRRDPKNRYPDPGALCEALNRYGQTHLAGASAIPPRPLADEAAIADWFTTDTSPGGRPGPASRPRLLAAGALALAAVLLLAVALTPPPRRGPPPPWPTGDRIARAEAILRQTASLSPEARLDRLRRLAAEHPETPAGAIAEAALHVIAPAGDPLPPAEREAAAMYARAMAAKSPPLPRRLERIASRYSETRFGRIAAAELRAIREREAERRRREEKRRREAERRERERQRREAAAAALDRAENLRDLPEVYLKKLRAVAEAPEYEGTPAAKTAAARVAVLEREAEARARRAEAAAAKRAAAERTAALHEALVQAAAEGELDTCLQLIDQLPPAQENPHLARAAAPYRYDRALLERFDQSLIDGLTGRLGMEVTLFLDQAPPVHGTIVGVDDRTVTLERESGEKVRRRVQSIAPRQQALIAALGYEGAQPEAAILAGLSLLLRGLPELAAEHFERAAENDPHAAHHRDLLRDVTRAQDAESGASLDGTAE